jgi:hypothetical protein
MLFSADKGLFMFALILFPKERRRNESWSYPPTGAV